jgi:hypothetical protein
VRMILAAAVGILCAMGARAETIGAPKVEVGDGWVYQNTTEDRTGWHQTRLELHVERVGAGTIAVDVKQAGSTMPPAEQLLGAD